MNQIRSEMANARRILKTQGLRALFQRYGWKLVVVLFCYYLVRDVSLYIVLPILIGKSFF